MTKEDFGDVTTHHIDFGGEQFKNQDVQAQKFLRVSKPIFDYIRDMGIGDLVRPEKKHIPGTFDYILQFQFLFVKLSVSYIIKIILGLALVGFLGVTFSEEIRLVMEKLKEFII
jgi:hypothetical protein